MPAATRQRYHELMGTDGTNPTPKQPRRRKKAAARASSDQKLTPPDLEPLDPVPARIIAGTQPRKPKQAKAGNPGKTATRAEVQERIIGTAKLLVRRLHKYQIKAFLIEKYDLSARMAEAYVSRAREHLIEQANRPHEHFVSDAVGF